MGQREPLAASSRTAGALERWTRSDGRCSASRRSTARVDPALDPVEERVDDLGLEVAAELVPRTDGGDDVFPGELRVRHGDLYHPIPPAAAVGPPSLTRSRHAG
jgi:hypothetical protein